MDSSALFDTSLFDFNPHQYHRHRSKQLSVESSLVPLGFTDNSQVAAKELEEMEPHVAPSYPASFGAARPAVVPDGPSTFESEFHILECDDLPSSLYSTRHRDSVSSSGSSLSVPASPVGMYPAMVGGLGKAASEEEEGLWNLVAYHIPWGSAYEGYAAGTLPGPDGPCLFLRSPTPSKKQRTSQACEKCRERKAKCSGTRPSCARCDARGHTCVYTPVHIPPSLTRSSNTSSPTRPLRSPSPTHSERLVLTGTYATSFSRKSSLTDSESSMSSNSTRDSAEARARSDGYIHESSYAVNHGSQPQALYSSPENNVPSATFPTTSIRDTQPPIFPSPLRGRLDDYRFPPHFEGSKSVVLVHPKPQSLGGGTISTLSNSIPESGSVFGNFGSIGVGLAGDWEEGLSGTTYEMDVEPSGAASGEPASAPCYAGALHHQETQAQSTLAITSNNGFFDSAYTAFEWSDPYDIKGAYHF